MRTRFIAQLVLFGILYSVHASSLNTKRQAETENPPDAPVDQNSLAQGNVYYYYYPVKEEQEKDKELIEKSSRPYLAIVIPLILLVSMIFLLGWLSNWTYMPLYANAFNITGGAGRAAYLDPMKEFRMEIDRLSLLYAKTASSEECLERLFCDMGQMMRGVKWLDVLLKFLDITIPGGMKRKFHIMRDSWKAEYQFVCDQYKCHHPIAEGGVKTDSGLYNQEKVVKTNCTEDRCNET